MIGGSDGQQYETELDFMMGNPVPQEEAKVVKTADKQGKGSDLDGPYAQYTDVDEKTRKDLAWDTSYLSQRDPGLHEGTPEEFQERLNGIIDQSQEDINKQYEETVKAWGGKANVIGEAWPAGRFRAKRDIPAIEHYLKNLPDDVEAIDMQDGSVVFRKSPSHSKIPMSMGDETYPVNSRPVEYNITGKEGGIINNIANSTPITGLFNSMTQGPFKQDVEDIKKIYDGIKSFVTAPGRALSGELKPGTSEFDQEVFGFAANMVGLPAPVAGKLADGTLGSFMGVKSKTLNKENLYKAQNLEMDGVSPDIIWQETRTFKGPDGRWRQEIPDEKSRIKEDFLNIKSDTNHPNGDWSPGEVTLKLKELPKGANAEQLKSYLNNKDITLPEILDHPELYKAYPELKDVKVIPLPKEWEGKAAATWNAGKNAIEIGKVANLDQLRSIILHEITHKTQDIEKFAKGGNAGMFKPKELPELEKILNAGKPEFEREITKSMGVLDTDIIHFKNAVKTELTDDRSKYVLDVWRKKNPEAISKLELLVKTEQAIAKNDAKNTEKYMRLMGEVEARNVQKRMNFDKFDREFNSPLRTQDRPTEVQTYTDGYIIPE